MQLDYQFEKFSVELVSAIFNPILSAMSQHKDEVFCWLFSFGEIPTQLQKVLTTLISLLLDLEESTLKLLLFLIYLFQLFDYFLLFLLMGI